MLKYDKILVEVYTSTLVPGIQLKNDCFDETGVRYIDSSKPVTQEEIDCIKAAGLKKVVYRTERMFTKVDNSNGAISEKSMSEAMNLLSDIELGLKKNSLQIPPSALRQVINNFIGDIQGNPNSFLNLLNITGMDQYTYTHSINVSTLSIMLGTALNFDNQKIYSLGVAGLLLDIGKSMIPPEVLLKEGKLNDEEKKMIRNHPVYGYNLLRNDPEMNRDILDGVLMHHENYAGGGYPLGIKSDNLSFAPQILAITDTFDACTTEKNYSRCVSMAEAVSIIMRQSGARFNPVYAKVFLGNMVKRLSEKPLFPKESFVILNTQEIGYVVGHTMGPHSLRPIINIIYNPAGKEKVLRHPLQINLEQDPNRTIIRRYEDEESIRKLILIRCKGDQLAAAKMHKDLYIEKEILPE